MRITVDETLGGDDLFDRMCNARAAAKLLIAARMYILGTAVSPMSAIERAESFVVEAVGAGYDYPELWEAITDAI